MDCKRCDSCRDFYVPDNPSADRSLIRKPKIELRLFAGEPITTLVQITPLSPAGNAIDLCPNCLQTATGQALRTMVRAAGGDIVKRQGD